MSTKNNNLMSYFEGWIYKIQNVNIKFDAENGNAVSFYKTIYG